MVKISTFSRHFVFLICLMFSSGLWANSKEVTLAKDFVTKLLDLGKLSKKHDADSKSRAKEIVKELSNGVDFEGLAAKSLHMTWQNTTKAKRKEFMDTLQGMIEEVLFPKAHKISAPLNEIEFSLHPKNMKRVKAKTRFETEKQGEIIEKDLEIDLIYSNAGLIEDAWIEGELVSANLQRQFDNALKKKSFDQILTQMKSKLKQKKAEDVEPESQAVKQPETKKSATKKAEKVQKSESAEPAEGAEKIEEPELPLDESTSEDVE